ncbi:hypothetical protein [Janthinobacterium svalbardensis]|nr:hypothetical protein [Janthinobacterium svalbardensis]
MLLLHEFKRVCGDMRLLIIMAYRCRLPAISANSSVGALLLEVAFGALER